MKILLLILFCCGFFSANAQLTDSKNNKQLYLKANAVFLPIGILNAAVEKELNENFTAQGEIFVSPWKSFAGKYLQMYMVGADLRYYFTESFSKWYVGANISGSRFIAQKWNYWGDNYFPVDENDENSPVYKASDLYQDGYSFLIGAVVGYQLKLNDRWNLDAFLGAGSNQSFYKGYHKITGERYDDPSRNWNRSGEWIPYRGGIMVSYKIQ